MIMKLPDRMTSQELCKAYGLHVAYTSASKAARRLIDTYNLPYRRVGYSWVRVDLIKLPLGDWTGETK